MVDKMLKTQIVECAPVIKWIFSDAMKNEFNSFYLWEIMHSTVNRMGKQVDKVRNEYNQLHGRYRKTSLDPDSVQSEISEEEIEQKLATLNSLKTQQKELFYLLIERFVDKLTQYLIVSDIKNEDGVKMEVTSPYFYKWAIERFEDILLTVILLLCCFLYFFTNVIKLELIIRLIYLSTMKRFCHIWRI